MKLQKIASLVLAIIMILSLGITAFAENETPTSGTNASTTGSVTVNSVSTEATYSIYQILVLESFDTTSGAHSYKANDNWKDFLAANEHIAIDAQGYVTWKGSEADSVVAEFAQEALAYAKEKEIAPDKTSANEGDFVITGTTGVFSNLNLGWYLVDTNIGALCGLTTTNPNASVNAKNGKPTVEKQVKEDSTGNWGTHNSAEIGQVVEFRTTIYAAAGAQNYVLHDKVSDGFTYGTIDGVTYGAVTGIKHVDKDGDHDVPTEKYDVVTATDACTLEIVFTSEFCEELEANDKIIVYYYATLDQTAVIGGAGNLNTAWVTYGENEDLEPDFKTEESQTITYTYGFDLIKTDAANKLIDGAEFRIYDAETGGNLVAVVETNKGYIRVLGNNTADDVIVANGQVRVYGLDNGTYYLEETVAPDGYNKLSARHKFIINNGNLDATFNGEVFSSGSGVHVVNKTGAMLPETGGIGTTLFYVVGGLLVGTAVVVLVSKKRMSSK